MHATIPGTLLFSILSVDMLRDRPEQAAEAGARGAGEGITLGPARRKLAAWSTRVYHTMNMYKELNTYVYTYCMLICIHTVFRAAEYTIKMAET